MVSRPEYLYIAVMRAVVRFCMSVVGKQAVASFVRGDRQSSGSGNRGVLPVCHGERERRLPKVSGGA
jgi:hypothetical protein